MHTTDFVLEELNARQRTVVDQLISTGKISVIVTEQTDDFMGITQLLTASTGLSFEDCSVWYYSKKLNGILLTGDGKLRKQANRDNVTVKGILYVFDQLVDTGIITSSQACAKLIELQQINPRLPQAEITKRLQEWGCK